MMMFGTLRATVLALALAPSMGMAQDWSGFAVGGSLGAIEGDGTLGAFVRRQGQIGRFVYGGEIAFTGFPSSDRAAADAVPYDQFWDVKGRFGIGADQVMPYVGAGLSVLSAQDNVFFEDFGLIWLAGLDYAVTDHVVLGAEYQYLVPVGENLFSEDTAGLGALSLRLAYRF